MRNFIVLVFILFAATAYAQTYTVERLIDGDTILLTNGETVQLIGVNAPNILPDGIDLTLYDLSDEDRGEMKIWGAI